MSVKAWIVELNCINGQKLLFQFFVVKGVVFGDPRIIRTRNANLVLVNPGGVYA